MSVFPTLAGLIRYLSEEHREFDGHVIVELEGELTDDVERGALLVRPVHIVGVHEIDPADLE